MKKLSLVAVFALFSLSARADSLGSALQNASARMGMSGVAMSRSTAPASSQSAKSGKTGLVVEPVQMPESPLWLELSLVLCSLAVSVGVVRRFHPDQA